MYGNEYFSHKRSFRTPPALKAGECYFMFYYCSLISLKAPDTVVLCVEAAPNPVLGVEFLPVGGTC